MKKHFLVLAVIICALGVQAQDAGKVFGSPTVIWYGIDFTKAKVLGFGDESPHKIRDEYFKAWNDVTIDIDLAKVFQKDAAYKDPNGISKMNLARETSDINTGEEVELTPEVIAEMVKQTPAGQKKVGLALVFIAQCFNKTAGTATVHVAFFDVATRKVLWLKKMTGKASGGNSKSAFTAALKDIFSQIEKKEYKAWKKEANY